MSNTTKYDKIRVSTLNSEERESNKLFQKYGSSIFDERPLYVIFGLEKHKDMLDKIEVGCKHWYITK